MKEPNKLNILERGSSLYGRGVPFFAALDFLEFGKNANSTKLSVAKDLSSFGFNLFGDNRSLRFSVRGFGCAPFFMLMGGYMSRNIQKRVIDVTGVELTPGKPAVCLGNGEQGYACCCDECDYFLLCFPEFDPKSKEESTDKSRIFESHEKEVKH